MPRPYRQAGVYSSQLSHLYVSRQVISGCGVVYWEVPLRNPQAQPLKRLQWFAQARSSDAQSSTEDS